MDIPESIPAFRLTIDAAGENFHLAGMDLRDYFAAAALTGLLAAGDLIGGRENFAREAYEYANAMLKQRGKK